MHPIPDIRRRRASRWFALTPLCAVALAACNGGSDDTAAPTGAPQISVLSGRADMVTGGDALVQVTLPPGASASAVKLSVGGRDISAALAPAATGGPLVAVVTGLAPGDNTITADAGGDRATLTVRNHPVTGPVFSGPHETPFICQTTQFRVYPGGPLLGTPQDTDCSIATRVDWVYRAADNSYKPFDPAAATLPADLKQTTTNGGATVPYIVRLETGTINRAIYQTAVLHDPRADASPSPTAPRPRGWNGRLVYPFGGGCGAGWYVQGTSTGGVLNDAILSQGYGTASASLNVFGTNCNDVLSAETAMMVKERFVETYGRPRHTIGWGCSGAAMQQYMIADNYPGILDGLVPSCSFPDPSNPASTDARLLHHYFNDTRAVPWTQAELAAASGYWGYNHVVNQSQGWSARLDTIPNRGNGYPSALFKPEVPASLRFDPVTNPGGARPTHWDHTVNVFGRDPQTGYARRIADNVGVQYGLGALNDRQITIEQFLDLNEKIGGADANGTFTASRTVGDAEGIRLGYETGRLMLGQGGLGSVPIIDWDQLDTEELPSGDLHLKFFHHMTRARLEKSTGSADNMVIWNGGSINTAYIGMQALARMDDWLTRIGTDTGAGSARDKVVRNKPASVADGCWRPATTAGADPVFVAERQFLGTRGTSQCNSLYPGYSYPRGVAGEPAASDIAKCQLKPIATTDYRVAFSAAEWTRLQAIFPTGVCNFAVPGVGQKPLAGTWLRFPSPGQFVKSGS